MNSENVMDHTEAVNMNASEKYFLGELTAEERNSFEEHYFTCAKCAADVNSTAVLLANTREVMTQRPVLETRPAVVAKRSSWLAWLRPWPVPVLAMLLLIVLGYQNLVTIPGLKQGSTIAPQSLATFSLASAASRGTSEVTVNVKKNDPFGLFFDIPPSGDFTSYICQVENRSGKQLASVEVSAQQARDSVQLLIPGGRLDGGSYQLVIRGNRAAGADKKAAEEVARLPFTVSYQ